ncbi:MAG: methyltransferase domain-containing protein [Methanobacterium sp.]|nr:methyltransferase domain-containing protein [Methanobacterium sp.]
MIKFLKEPLKKQMRKTGMVRELEIEKKKLRNQIGNLNSQLNKLKTENCNLKKIITNLEAEKIELKHGLSNFIESKFNPLKNDNDNLKKENHVLEDQLNNAISVNQKLSERSALVAQLNDRVSDLKKENHVLEDQLKKTQAKNQNLKERKKSLKIENQKLLSERTGIVGYSLKNGLRGMSTDAGKPAIIKYILENVDKWNSKILDVGFGSGVYGKLLRAFLYQNIDGVDVYEDNIKEMGLDKIYDNIHIKNILDFDFEYYDLIIMGDVLEHIELESSKKLLSRFIKNNKCGNIIVSIPYEYKQGEAYGNPYEKHLQPNANKEYMEEHYPYLQLIDTSTIPRRGGIMATYVWNKYMPHID